MTTTSTPEESPREKNILPQSSSSRLKQTIFAELRKQQKLSIPLIAMNLTWFAKIAITTLFLGRLGELQLAGGTLGFTFANVTGFSVLSGLCGAMEPICGQAFGAKNYKLLHNTILMTTMLLLAASLPISFLWLNVDKILIHFGQQRDISIIAKHYVIYLLPDLLLTSFLSPLKAYLTAQNITIPIMFTSALAVALHLPLNFILSNLKGLQGVSMAIWLTDAIVVILLSLYVWMTERSKKEWSWKEGGWWDQRASDWVRLIRLCGPCCLTTCLEWWCIEILVLLTGRLKNAKEAVAVLAIVLNFDYLLYSVMLSLATCVSIRVSNELGANQAIHAYQSANVSLIVSVVFGCIGSSVMVAVRDVWGSLFSHSEGVLRGVKTMMLIMAAVEVVNFPLTLCGGIVRGTARPWLAMYANLAGFYLLALPLGVVLAFKIGLQLSGLLWGFLIGMVACLILLLVFVVRIDWVGEAHKALQLSCGGKEVSDRGKETTTTSETVDAIEV